MFLANEFPLIFTKLMRRFIRKNSLAKEKC